MRPSLSFFLVVQFVGQIKEALIGRGKRLEGQQSQRGFTRYVLGLAASVVTPTAEHLPPSVQAKRLRDLGRRSKEQKQDKHLAHATLTF